MKNLFAILLSVWLLVSCATVPFLSRVKEAIENNSPLKETIFLNDYPELSNQKLQSYLNNLVAKVADKLGIVAPRIVAVDTKYVQGSVSYSGPLIRISKGMLYSIKNEAELVAFIGHEVGHMYLRHGLEEEQSKHADIIDNILEPIINDKLPPQLTSRARDIYLSQFNKDNEAGADIFGAKMAASLGYNPYAFSDLFTRLGRSVDLSKLDKLLAIKGTHYTLEERGQKIRKFLKKNNYTQTGVLNQASYLKNVRQLYAPVARVKVLETVSELDKVSLLVSKARKENRPLTKKEMKLAAASFRKMFVALNIKPKKKPLNGQGGDRFMMERLLKEVPWWAEDAEIRQQVLDELSELAKLAVGFTLVGDAVDIYEVVFGVDAYTGEELTYGERLITSAGIIVGSGKAYRQAARVEKEGLQTLDRKIAELFTDAEETFVKKTNISKADNFRLIKNKKNYEELTKLTERVELKNIPDDFRVKVSRPGKNGGQGVEYINPSNAQKRIRVMPGNPNSPYKNSQKPYVVVKSEKGILKKNGKVQNRKSESTHIPLDEFNYKNFKEYLE